VEDNVYEAPKSDLAIQEETTTDYPLATRGQRFINLLIDYFFVIVLSIILGVLGAVFGLGQQIDQMNDNLFGVIVMTLYYLPQEAVWGTTLGKLVTKTRVVDLNGNEIAFGKALGRTLCRFIPFEGITFLGGNGRPHGIHDKLAKTKVISLKQA